MKTIKSPINDKLEAELIRKISFKDVVKMYKKQLNINISSYNYEGIKDIEIYKCKGTNYMFYYPYNLAGDGLFYEKLQGFKWYYMPWKWEHELAIKFFKKEDNILEIGCGQGGFLENIKKLGYDNIKGIELNENAVGICHTKKLDVELISLKQHILNKEGYYDVVCSFQVMEHISDVGDVLEDSISSLRRGGKLIISVPNNDSFLSIQGRNSLNYPPHHMGLWSEDMALNLENFFPIKLVDIKKETLQTYHVGSFYSAITQNSRDKWGVFFKFFDKIFKKNIIKEIEKIKDGITGHTLFLVFEKL